MKRQGSETQRNGGIYAMSNRAGTVIPPTISTLARIPLAPTAKRRVTGYARVSTDSKEQMISYKTQVDYYSATFKNSLTGDLSVYIPMWTRLMNKTPKPACVMIIFVVGKNHIK